MGSLVPTLGFSLVGIISASAIALTLAPASATKRFFETRILRFFGKYSYGIYVYHYSIGGWIGAPVRSFVDATTHVKALGVLFSAVIAGAASVAVAWLSYRFYEVFFLRLKRFHNGQARS